MKILHFFTCEQTIQSRTAKATVTIAYVTGAAPHTYTPSRKGEAQDHNKTNMNCMFLVKNLTE